MTWNEIWWLSGNSFNTTYGEISLQMNNIGALLFQAWPEDALERVANKYLEHVEISDEQKVETVHICKYFHTSAADLSDKYVKCNHYM